ncbi:MAG: GNAT family N-acetyltransferase [Pseudomonadota bacterium]
MSLISPPLTQLQTARLSLRAPQPEDEQDIMAFYMSPRSKHVGGPYDRVGAWHRAAGFFGHWALRGHGKLISVERATGARVGTVGVGRPEGWPERDLNWTIWSDAYEGRGYAFEATKALRDAVAKLYGWTGLVSYIEADNARSIKLAERLGAVLDPQAPPPDPYPCLVYRHPKSEEPQ